MEIEACLRKIRRDEHGVVLIIVLIIAGIFAILAYTALAVTISSLNNTDSNRNAFLTRQVAESGVNSGAYRLLVDPGQEGDSPAYIDPSVAFSVTEDELKKDLINADFATSFQLDSFPTTIQRTAYTTSTDVSTYFPDTDIIPGDPDKGQYSYVDDTTFSHEYPGYEYAQVQQTGNLHIYGVGEVDEPQGDTTLFSFVRGSYPNVQWNYDVRQTGITEPSRLGPYPLIESVHPYDKNTSRAWSVTYQSDPRHTGRSITGISLMADPDEIQIDSGDNLWITPWLENLRQYQNPPPLILNSYTNGTTETFTPIYPTHTIGLYFLSDTTTVDANMEYGLRVSGVRYGFDSDYYAAYYETAHPYDHLVSMTNFTNLNIQVILSPYQAAAGSPSVTMQQMQIAFDDKFSLDPGDRVYLLNASDSTGAALIAQYTSVSPPPVGGFVPSVTRVGSDLPLGYIIILYRNHANDSDGTPNYGYKVGAMEYTDADRNWVHVNNPVVESPHVGSLGSNDSPYTLPPLPFPAPVGLNLVSYQTIYKPAVPKTDDPSKLGTVTEWFASFSDGCDIAAPSGPVNTDYVRLTTPGNPLLNGHSSIYFVNPNSALGLLIDNDQYFDIGGVNGLKNFIAECGDADYLQVELRSDDTDAYLPSFENFGYQVARVGYLTDNGVDDDSTPPTIRSDQNYPANTSYPAFGEGAYKSTEWWYSNKNALVIGLHVDRHNFNLDPGDRIEVYDENGILIATLIPESASGGPSAGGPINPDQPGGGQQPGQGPGASGPILPDETVAGTVIDLNATYGWVLVPGKTARVRLVGDGDDNEGYCGFEIDHCGFINGDITEIRNYVTEYASVAYDKYFDRTAEPLERFRSLGVQ